MANPTYREEFIVDRVEILADGTIQVRKATVLYKDEVEKSREFERYIVLKEEPTPQEVLDFLAAATGV